MQTKTIKVGDEVMWRGNWGRAPAAKGKVKSITLLRDIANANNAFHGGIKVDQIHDVDKDRAIFTFGCGHWAYGKQVIGK